MNKVELIKLIEDLNLDKDEYYILGSGSLVMHGIREVANDLDLCVTEETFEILKTKFNIDLSSKNECGFYFLNDVIEVVISNKEDFNRNFIEGYPVEKLEKILEFKKNRNKEKDKFDIIKIEEYLFNKNY